MSNESNHNMNGKDFIIGAFVGGIIGACAALLLAPKSGRELREDISSGYQTATRKTQELAQNVSGQTEQLVGRVKDVAGQVKDVAGQLKNEVVKWKNHSLESVDELKEELKEALSEAEHEVAAAVEKVKYAVDNSFEEEIK